MNEVTSEAVNLPVWQKGPITLRCVNRYAQTHNVTTFQFVSDPAVRFHFKPGQFIALQLMIDGKKIIRSYTVSSSPSRPYLLELTIKLDEQGLVSQWMHDNVKVGTEINARGPNGIFNNWDIPTKRALLISAGSGITPLMSMARWWIDSAADTDIVFFHAATRPHDIIFEYELHQYDHLHDNFTLQVACTRPTADDNWQGLSGRIDLTMLKQICPDFMDRHIYCCGPTGFMETVKTMLAESGFPEANYADESFGGASKKSKPAAAPVNITVEQTPPVETVEAQTEVNQFDFSSVDIPRGMYGLHFSQSEQTLILDENDIVLEKANEAGVFIDSACTAGNCGMCKVKKLSGEVETENTTGLDPASADEGYILTCTTRLKSNVVLDV